MPTPPTTLPAHSSTPEPKSGRKSWLLQKACDRFKGEIAKIYETFVHPEAYRVYGMLSKLHGPTALNSKF